MSQTIDDRIVQLEFDNSDFEPQVQESLTTLQKLKQALKFDDAANNLTSLNDVAKKVDISAAAENVDSVSEKILGKLSTLNLGMASALGNIFSGLTKDLIIDPIAQSISGGIARSQNIADAKFQLEGLGVAWEKIYDDIDYAVSGTAFGLDAAAKAASQLTASGVEMGQEMKAALRGISGVAAMGAATYEEISPIFTKAAGNGRVMADELNRISAHGLNAASELAKFFNTIEDKEDVPVEVKDKIKDLTKGLKVTESDIRDFASKSKISFDMFAYAMDGAFGQHAKDANKTFSGAMANMKAALNRIGEKFREPIMDAMVDVFNALRKMIDTIKGLLQPVIDVWSVVVKVTGKYITDAITNFDKFLKKFTGAKNISNGLLNILYIIGSVFKTIVWSFNRVFHKNSSLDGLNSAAESFENFTQKLIPTKEALNKISEIFVKVFTVIKNVGGSLTSVFSKIIGIAGKVLQVLTIPITYIGKSIAILVKIIQNAASNSKNFTGFLYGIVSAIRNVIPGTENLTRSLMRFVPTISTIISYLKNFATIVGGVLFGAVWTAVNGIITAINKLKALSLKGIINQIKTFISKLKSLPQVSEAINNIKSSLNGLKSFFGGVLDSIVNFFGAFRKESDTTARSVSRDMSTLERIISGITTVFEGLGAILGGAVLAGLTLFNKAFTAIKNFKISSVIENIKEFITSVKEIGLLETLSQTFERVGGTIGELLLKVIEKIKEFMQEIKDSGGIIDWFLDKLIILGSKLSEIKDSIINALFGSDDTRSVKDSKLYIVIDTLKEKFQSLKEIMAKGMDYIQKNGLLTKTLMLLWLGSIMKGMFSFARNSKKVTDAMTKGEGMFSAFKNFGDLMASLNDRVRNGIGPFASLSKAIEAWGEAQQKTGAEKFAIVMKSVAIAIGTVAASMALLYKVVDDTDKFKEIAIGLGIIMGVVIAIAGAMTIIASIRDVDQKFFISFAANMIAMAACLGVMGLVVNALGKLEDDQLMKGIVALGAILFAFVIAQTYLSKVSQSGVKIVAHLKGILKMAGKVAMAASSLVLIAIGIAAMAAALQKVKDLNLGSPTEDDSLIIGLIYIGGIFAAVITASMFAGPATLAVLQISAALALLGIAAFNIVLVSKIMKAVDPTGLGIAGIVLISLASIFGALAYFLNKGGEVTKGLLMIAISLTFLGNVAIKLALVSKLMENVSWSSFWKTMLLLVTLVGSMVILINYAAKLKNGQTWKPILAALGGLSLIMGMIMIMSFMVSNDEIFWNLIKATGFVAAVITGLCVVLNYTSKIKNGDGWKTLLTTFLILGTLFAALLVLSNQMKDWQDILKLTAIAGILVGALAAIVLITEMFAKFAKNSNMGQGKWSTKSLIMLGAMVAALAAIATTLVIASQHADWFQLITTSAILIGALAALVLICRLMVGFTKNVKWEELAKAGVILGALVVTITILATVLNKISNVIGGNDYTALLALTAIITMLFVSAFAFTKLGSVNAAEILKASLVMAIMIVMFVTIGAVLYALGTLDVDSGILAKSQVIMLVLAELIGIAVILGAAATLMVTAIGALPSLFGMIALFSVLAIVISGLDLLTNDVTGVLAKSQVIMLVLAELVGICAILGVGVGLFVAAIGALPGLVGLTLVFGVLAIVLSVISTLELDGILEKSQVLMLILLELVGILGILGLLSFGAVGELAGAAAILMIAIALGPLTAALQNMQDLDFNKISEGLTVIATGLLMIMAAGALGATAGLGLIVLAARIGAVGVACIIASAGVMMFANTLAMIGAAIGTALSGVVEVASAIVEGFKEKLSEIIDFIEDLIQTIKDKLSDPIGSLKNAGTKMGASLVNAFREATGWHSPPKFIVDFFKDCGIAVNDKANGVTDLFEGTGNDWGSALTQALQSKLGDFDLKSIGSKMGLDLGNGFFGGASVGIGGVLSLFGIVAKNAKNVTIIQHELIQKVQRGEITVDEFNKSMLEAAQGSGSLTDALDSLGDMFDTTGGKAKGAGKSVESFTDSLEKTLQGQLNIFSKFEAKSAMSKEELLNNMKSQIQGMANWAAQMNKLATMGIDQGLYQKLAEMGPEGAEYVGAFVSMSAEELGMANELWAESLVLPGAVAKQIGVNMNEIGQNTLIGYQNGLDAQTNQTLEQLGVIANAGIDTFAGALGIHSPSTVFFNMGLNCMAGLINGIDSRKEHLYNELIRICNIAVEIVRQKLDPETVFKPIGIGVIEGLIMGLTDPGMLEQLNSAVEALAVLAEEAIQYKLEINSPSKVFARIGSAIPEGMAKGITDNVNMVDNAVGNMADNAVAQMKQTIAGIASMINNEISDPVITPVLDLSKVQAGARLLNNTFSANAAIAAGASQLGTLQNGQYNPQGGMQFIQNNYSPKALSRIDIYRDTRNMLSQFKQATT